MRQKKKTGAFVHHKYSILKIMIKEMDDLVFINSFHKRIARHHVLGV